jgi:hypothetical protein
MKVSYPPSFPRADAARLLRVRRYAVPRRMIQRATERRLAGDWAGACAAAGMDVAFNFSRVAFRHGAAVAAELEVDLAHLAPDLLRWHWSHGYRVVLAAYGEALLYARPSGPGTRMTLDFETAGDFWQRSASRNVEHWETARHLWDARHAGEVRERCGGADRVPFFEADGTPRAADLLPTADPGPGDPVGRAEWLALLHDRGEMPRLLEALGIEVVFRPGPRAPGSRLPHHFDSSRRPGAVFATLARMPIALAGIEREMRRLAAAGFGRRFRVHPVWRHTVVLELPGGGGPGVRVSLEMWETVMSLPWLPKMLWRRLPDLDLLRLGVLSTGELHPLVAAALFPARVPAEGEVGGPVPPVLPGPVRVRCGGDWHEIRAIGGRLRAPHSAPVAAAGEPAAVGEAGDADTHEDAGATPGAAVAATAAEVAAAVDRPALAAAETACDAAVRAWTTGKGRLPRVLRGQRQVMFALLQYGDTPGLVQLIEAGADMRVRDGERRTLLHQLHLVDWQVMLPLLLAAGVDIEARDDWGRTPLYVAAHGGWHDLAGALLDAEARPETVDETPVNPSLAQHSEDRTPRPGATPQPPPKTWWERLLGH